MILFLQLLNMYKKHTSSEKTPLEDFTTELFAGVLDRNVHFKNAFCEQVLRIPNDDYVIKTQSHFNSLTQGKCIIDLVLTSENNICFIENKVEASEGDGQLEKYKEILIAESENSIKNVYLRYCTKIDDYKDIRDINFHQFRWEDIYYLCIDFKSDALISCLLEYLEAVGLGDNSSSKKYSLAKELLKEGKVKSIERAIDLANLMIEKGYSFN